MLGQRFKVPGNWRVTTFCCASGYCFTCQRNHTQGDMQGRERVVFIQNVTEAAAREIEERWAEYGAVAEPMPPAAGETDALVGAGL